MTDYMEQDAERLIQTLESCAVDPMSNGYAEVSKRLLVATTCSLRTLLAHIQRGAPAPAEVPMPEPDTHCYDEDERRDVWSHSADQMRTYGAAREAAGYARGRADERERICAAIKAEDDYCVTEGDYMLDSDDCIRVARGTWERPDYALRGEVKP